MWRLPITFHSGGKKQFYNSRVLKKQLQFHLHNSLFTDLNHFPLDRLDFSYSMCIDLKSL